MDEVNLGIIFVNETLASSIWTHIWYRRETDGNIASFANVYWDAFAFSTMLPSLNVKIPQTYLLIWKLWKEYESSNESCHKHCTVFDFHRKGGYKIVWTSWWLYNAHIGFEMSYISYFALWFHQKANKSGVNRPE